MSEFCECGSDGEKFTGSVESRGYLCLCGRTHDVFHNDADNVDDTVTWGLGGWGFLGYHLVVGWRFGCRDKYKYFRDLNKHCVGNLLRLPLVLKIDLRFKEFICILLCTVYFEPLYRHEKRSNSEQKIWTFWIKTTNHQDVNK